MSSIALTPNVLGTGTLTLAAPNTNTARTLTLPDATTTLVGTDATQTLSNKTIAASQLTGALPAIDGSALTGIATGGMTLLGTLATTSGSTVTLSGLNLTSYKMLYFVFVNVSVVAGTTTILYFEGRPISPQIGTVSNGWRGNGFVELGTTTSIFNLVSTSTISATGSVNYSFHAVTTASTSLSFTQDTSTTFDAGSILIYGVK